MPRIAWVRRQRAGANPGGPPLLDLWLLCWSMAGGVVRCFIDAIFGWCVVLLMRYLGIVWGPGYPRESESQTPEARAIAWGSPAKAKPERSEAKLDFGSRDRWV